MTGEVLQHMERMLNFGAHARLGLFQLFFGPAQQILLQRLAHAALHRDVPGLALLRLVHFRVALLVLVLGRGRRCDQGRVNDRPSRIIKPLLARWR